MKTKTGASVVKAAEKIVKEDVKHVKLEQIDICTMNVAIVGTSPLIMHKFSVEAQDEMLAKQNKQTKARTARIPVKDEVERCIHRNGDGGVCFPAGGFYNGMREVAPYFSDLDKKLVSGAIKVFNHDGDPFITIDYKKMDVRKDVVVLSSGVPDIRHRPAFQDWSCKLQIQYNASLVSPQQIIQLINYSGFHRGIGDWRPGSPKKPGGFGMYKVSVK